jgi:hypothetical protein
MIILGVLLLSGELPGAGRVWIVGVYRSGRRLPRRILVGEGESDGVWRLLGEGEESFGSHGMGGAFIRRARGARGGLRVAEPRNILQVSSGSLVRLLGARVAWRELSLCKPPSHVTLLVDHEGGV